ATGEPARYRRGASRRCPADGERVVKCFCFAAVAMASDSVAPWWLGATARWRFLPDDRAASVHPSRYPYGRVSARVRDRRAAATPHLSARRIERSRTGVRTHAALSPPLRGSAGRC